MSQSSYRSRGMEKMKEKEKKARRITIVACAFVVLIILIIILINTLSDNKNGADSHPGESTAQDVGEKESGRIEDGVYIETIAAGGMDYTSVMAACEQFVSEISKKTVNMDIEGTIKNTTLGALGLKGDIEKAIDEAFAMEEAGLVHICFDVDEDTVKKYIKSETAEFVKKAKNASLKRENGEFVIKKSKTGKGIDYDASYQNLAAVVSTDVVNPLSINTSIVVTEKQPKYTTEDMKKCKDVLGKFSTTYNSYQADRTANLKNAVSFINGQLVYPGQKFSVADTIYPLTEDNGYKLAPSYASGQVVDSLGGGVCQVSTTLYNAVLLSELQIAERAPHSMAVSYVKPSMDAAIAGDYKDFKFVNNTDAPIYIQGYVGEGVITFTIYGEETRDSSRSIKFESEIVEEIQPGAEVVKKDNTQPETYRKVTQEAHVGYVANLYKIIYENGKEVSKEKINTSRYSAEPRYVIVGTKKVKDKDKSTKDNNKDKNNSDKNKTDKNNTKEENRKEENTKEENNNSSESENDTPQQEEVEQTEQPAVQEPDAEIPVVNDGV